MSSPDLSPSKVKYLLGNFMRTLIYHHTKVKYLLGNFVRTKFYLFEVSEFEMLFPDFSVPNPVKPSAICLNKPTRQTKSYSQFLGGRKRNPYMIPMNSHL